MRHSQPTDTDRTPLLQVQIQNANGAISERFVPVVEYDLWHQLVVGRHRITPLKRRPCLWSTEQASEAPTPLEHASVRINVTRLTFSGFDNVLGVRRQQTRYSASNQTQHLADLMLGHFQKRYSDLELKLMAGAAYAESREQTLVDPTHALTGTAGLDYIELSCNMPRGLAPARSTMRS